jgi:hypothetical protein
MRSELPEANLKTDCRSSGNQILFTAVLTLFSIRARGLVVYLVLRTFRKVTSDT